MITIGSEENIDKKELLRRLLEGPQLIKEQEIHLFQMQTRKEELLVKLKLLQNSVYEKVNGETVLDKEQKMKNKFTNESQRQAETKARLKMHEGHTAAQNDHDELIRKIKISTIELDFMRRVWQSAKAIAYWETIHNLMPADKTGGAYKPPR